MMLLLTSMGQNDSVIYWKRHASLEPFNVGFATDFAQSQIYNDHYSIGVLEFTLGLTKNKHPMVFSSGLTGIYEKPFFNAFHSQNMMNIPSFRLGIRMFKSNRIEAYLTSGIGFVLNNINRTISGSNIPGMSSSQFKITYYPLKYIGVAFGTNFYFRSNVAVLTNYISISFRNGL